MLCSCRSDFKVFLCGLKQEAYSSRLHPRSVQRLLLFKLEGKKLRRTEKTREKGESSESIRVCK